MIKYVRKYLWIYCVGTLVWLVLTVLIGMGEIG